MSFEPIISIASLIAGAAGIYFVLHAYGRTIKSAEPDQDRVQRFVDSAPLGRLSNIKAS